MVTKKVLKKIRENAEALRKNPLLGKMLRELLLEKDRLIVEYPCIVKPQHEIPFENIGKYREYHKIINELERRGNIRKDSYEPRF